MLEWNCITGCYRIEIPEHLKFYTTQKSQLFINILDIVYSRFSREMVERGLVLITEKRGKSTIYTLLRHERKIKLPFVYCTDNTCITAHDRGLCSSTRH